jgi:hypothetical protein
MRRMRKTSGLLLAGLLGLGGLFACQGGEPGPEGPSAKERQGRSEVLRGLIASKENVDPGALKAAGAEAKGAPVSAQPVSPDEGTGGSGTPESVGWAAGRVSWVGDNELLFVDGSGEEREVLIEASTQLRRDDQDAQLRDFSEGDEIRVNYEDTGQAWIARDVDAVPARRLPAPNPESPPLR